MTKLLHTNLKCDAHAYMRSPEPWRIDAGEEVYGAISRENRRGWRLFHYISGGGMRTFGRTVRQEEVRRRQRRFCIEFVVLALVWLALLVF